MRFIHVEHGHGGSAGSRAADKYRTDPSEVAAPALPAWMEERDHVAVKRVAAAKIRALLEVAPVAAPAAVLGQIRTAVLPGDDVLDVEGRYRYRPIRKVTVFAAAAGPFSNDLAERLSHRGAADCFRRARAFACRMAMTSIV